MVQQYGSMHKVELTWNEVMSGQFPTTPARTLYSTAVIDAAAQALATMPAQTARVEKARDMVLGGLVRLQSDDSFVVRSQASTDTTYHVVGDLCNCPDAGKAEGGRCKHVIASWIWRKARFAVLLHLDPPAIDPAQTVHEAAATYQAAPRQAPRVLGTPAALPEAPASVNVFIEVAGRKVQLTLRDSDEQRLLQRLAAVLAQQPQEGAAPDAAARAETPAAVPSCPTHGAEKMKPSKFGQGKFFCAAKNGDGWCNAAWPARSK